MNMPSATQNHNQILNMPSATMRTRSIFHLPPVLTIRDCSGETKTLSDPDENTPQKFVHEAKDMDLPGMSILSRTPKTGFNILCGAVVVDVQLHAILGSMNRVTGRVTLPKKRQIFETHESMDYVALTAVVDQTGWFACSNWFFTDHSLALEVKSGHVAEPFEVQQRFNDDGKLDIIFWFAMQGNANDPNRGWTHPLAPLNAHAWHKLGEDFDETWCYGYEEAVKKFNDDDKDVVKDCLALAYGGPDRWRMVERKFGKELGFGLSKELAG